MTEPVRIIKTKPVPKTNRLAWAFLAVSVYAVLITPLAHQEARRQVILWASEQPDMPITKQHTRADLDEIAKQVAKTPALTTKEWNGKNAH